MNSPIPVLYVSSISGIGGAELSLLELASYLDRSSFCPHLYVPANGPLVERFRAIDVPIHWGHFPFFRKRYPFEYWGAVLRMMQVIRHEAIQVVHVNCDRAVPISVLASRLTRVPCVCYIHDFLRAWYLPAYVKYLNQAQGIVADSLAIAQQCRDKGMRPDKLVVIYESVLTEQFSFTSVQDRRRIRSEYGLADEHLIFGIVGKVTPHKGHQDLVDAIAIAKKQLSKICVLVVGDTSLTGNDAYPDVIRRRAAALGIDSALIFTGLRQDVPAVMAAIDVLIVPSRTEAFGRVAAEALAAGKPVIATKTGGLPEVVQDGVTGYLVPPREPEALAEALVRLGSDPSLRFRMGQRGPASVAKFDVRVHVAQFTKLYQALRASEPVPHCADFSD